MFILTLWLLLVSGGLSSSLSSFHVPTATIVSKRNGNSKTVFVGRTLSEFDQDVFLGIKYANEPVRFTPSELKTKYASNDSSSGSLNLSGTGLTSSAGYNFYNATQYGYDCPGYGSDTTNLAKMGLINLNEDCLNLNIIRPKTQDKNDVQELLPVMLWIYGGGWQQGATADPRYFMNSLVEANTISYDLLLI